MRMSKFSIASGMQKEGNSWENGNETADIICMTVPSECQSLVAKTYLA
jgi:hypothetical protein